MKAFLLSLALAAALTGCAIPGQFGSSNVRYYVLSSTLPPDSASAEASVGVLPVALPGYLNRQQIVLRDADGVSISIRNYDRWGESLSMGISRVLCDTLAAKGVSALPMRIGAKMKDKLMLDVRRLDGALGGDAVLDVMWRLQRDGETLQSGHMVKRRPAGNSIESIVNAQSQLVQDLAASIAARIR